MRRGELAGTIGAACVTIALVALAGFALASHLPDGAAAGDARVTTHAPSAGHTDSGGGMDPDRRVVISGINQLGIHLLQRKLPANEKAVIVSPISLHQALAMVAAGASGATLTQMRHVLGFDALTESASNQAYANLLTQLGSDDGHQLAIANFLWADDGVALKKPFLDTDSAYFGSEIRTVDLQSSSAPRVINDWVSKQTHGKITQVAEKPYDSAAILELINATYFLGTWPKPFDPAQQKDFHLADGTVVKAPLMKSNAEHGLQHAKTGSYEAVRLGYEDSGASMYVILPPEGTSLDAFVGSMNASSFADTANGLRESRAVRGDVTMPKIEAKWKSSLRDTLSALGMPDAFSPDKAQFARATDLKPVWIDSDAHLTYLRVDEKGTEAAAATQFGLAGAAAPLPPAQPFHMLVDRPYVMAIADDRSGAILFLASVRDPR